MDMKSPSPATALLPELLAESQTEEGVPQGGRFPMLANVYLHAVLDLWFDRVFARQCRGKACLVRFADDYVTCFQSRADAERFSIALSGDWGSST